MTVQTPPPSPPRAPIPYQPVALPPPSPHRGRLVAVITAIVLIAVGGITAIVGSHGNGSRPAAPTQLRPTSVTSTTASIAWTPATSTSPTKFRIYRNGHLIDAVGAHTYRYTDSGLAPSASYRYQVSAFDKQWSALSSTLAVTTHHASLAAARLFTTSQYAVKIAVTSEYGYTTVGAGDRSRQTWWFNTRPAGRYMLLGNLHAGSFKMPIRQRGLSFNGTTHENLSSCSYVPVNTTVRLSMHTVKGGTVDGVWGVTRFTGTLHQTAPATSAGLTTCSGAGYTATVTGRIVR